VSNDDIKLLVEVLYFGDVDENVEYSIEFDISSIVFSIFVLVILEISSVVADINVVVDSSILFEEVKSVWESVCCNDTSEVDARILGVDCVSRPFLSVVILANVEETKLIVDDENDGGSVELTIFNRELLGLIEVLMEVDDCS